MSWCFLSVRGASGLILFAGSIDPLSRYLLVWWRSAWLTKCSRTSCRLRALAQSHSAWPPSGSSAYVSAAAVAVAISVAAAAVVTAFALSCCWCRPTLFQRVRLFFLCWLFTRVQISCTRGASLRATRLSEVLFLPRVPAPTACTIRDLVSNITMIREIATKSNTILKFSARTSTFRVTALFFYCESIIIFLLTYIWKVYNKNIENHHFLHPAIVLFEWMKGIIRCVIFPINSTAYK